MLILSTKALLKVLLALSAVPAVIEARKAGAGTVAVAGSGPKTADESEGPAWTCMSDEDIFAALSRKHEDMELVTITGCHFGNTDTCSDITWYHRSRGVFWASALPMDELVPATGKPVNKKLQAMQQAMDEQNAVRDENETVTIIVCHN
ncbi:hypothetical protein SEUCBS139899_004294 [Sporothrix eucalyptigena]